MTKEEKVSFFIHEVPVLLAELNADSKPLWGVMNAVEMVEHLAAGLRLSQRRDDFPIATPEEHLPKYKAFLMSDKPLPHHAVKPEGYAMVERTDVQTLERAIESLIHEIPKFLKDLESENYRSVHRDFGVMNPEESLQMHYKHFQHHFRQFGLIPMPA